MDPDKVNLDRKISYPERSSPEPLRRRTGLSVGVEHITKPEYEELTNN